MIIIIMKTVIPIVVGVFGTIAKWLVKGTGGVGNLKTSRDHPNYSIVRIGQNTEKNPGHLRRLAVTQTPVNDYQLTLVGKTCKK